MRIIGFRKEKDGQASRYTPGLGHLLYCFRFTAYLDRQLSVQSDIQDVFILSDCFRNIRSRILPHLRPVARCMFDDIRDAYEDEEIRKEFAEWQAEQAAKKAELKLHKKARAADTAALVVYFCFFFPLGPRGLDSGRIFQPFAK